MNMQAMTVSVSLRAKDGISPVISKVNANLARFESRTTQLAKSAGKFGAVGMAGAVGLGHMFSQPIKSAIAFESAMADVKKVVNFTPNTKEFKTFSAEILNLSTKIPLAASQLATIAASGGQLGIAKDKIIGFTTVVAKMSTAFDMMPSQAGDSIAKLMNIYGLSIEGATSLGDAINHMSDNSAAKAAAMIDVLVNVGGTASGLKLSAVDVAALANGFVSLGMKSDVASTSINAMLTKLNTATGQSKKFKTGLKALGLTPTEMESMIGNNAKDAIMTVLEKIEKLDDRKRGNVLLDMFGMEYVSKISTVVNKLDLYRKAVGLVSDEHKYAGSMEKEFQARSATTENQLVLLKNTVNTVAITLGSVLLPTVNKVIGKIQSVAEAVATWTEHNKPLAESIMKYGAIAIGIIAGLSAFSMAVSAILFSVSGVTKALKGGMWLFTKFGRKGAAAAEGIQAVSTAMDAVAGKSLMARMGVTVPKKMSVIGRFKGLLASVASYALANPIGLAVTVAAGAGIVAYSAYKYQQEHQGEASLGADKKMVRQYERERNIPETQKTVSTEQVVEAKIRQQDWREQSKKLNKKFEVAAKVTSIEVSKTAMDSYMESLRHPATAELFEPANIIGRKYRNFTTAEVFEPADIVRRKDRSFKTTEVFVPAVMPTVSDKKSAQNVPVKSTYTLQSMLAASNHKKTPDVQKVELKKPIIKNIRHDKKVNISAPINITIDSTNGEVNAEQLAMRIGKHLHSTMEQNNDNTFEDKD